MFDTLMSAVRAMGTATAHWQTERCACNMTPHYSSGIDVFCPQSVLDTALYSHTHTQAHDSTCVQSAYKHMLHVGLMLRCFAKCTKLLCHVASATKTDLSLTVKFGFCGKPTWRSY